MYYYQPFLSVDYVAKTTFKTIVSDGFAYITQPCLLRVAYVAKSLVSWRLLVLGSHMISECCLWCTVISFLSVAFYVVESLVFSMLIMLRCLWFSVLWTNLKSKKQNLKTYTESCSQSNTSNRIGTGSKHSQTLCTHYVLEDLNSPKYPSLMF